MITLVPEAEVSVVALVEVEVDSALAVPLASAFLLKTVVSSTTTNSFYLLLAPAPSPLSEV